MAMAGISAAATGNGKAKVVILMGATATGKSKLAVDIALRSNGEVVNSDKIQVHDGLPVVTNKATAREQVGVPHHMIGGVHPNADYTAADFRRGATRISYQKVVILMGSTATGKSKPAVDIALRFNGEVVNSDKIQVHDGLHVVTNKATAREQVRVHPDADYTTADFRRDTTRISYRKARFF
ncbi:isopentenyltransferase 7 [Hordeum vulgare]|nr:isopentenyltransferase 7 [Hordeum vulgare]